MEKTEAKQELLDFVDFQKRYGVKIVSIGMECPSCHNIWGFKVFNEKTIRDVKPSKLVCFACASKGIGECEKTEDKN